MSMQYFIEKWDAKHGIPRPADAPHLNAYHAFLRCIWDASEMFFLVACGFGSAVVVAKAADNVQATGQGQLIFAGLALLGIVISLADASRNLIPYLRVSQRITHGSAEWADVAWLKRDGFVPAVGGEVRPGQLKLGTLTTGLDLILPASHTLRHLALFGPPGSGKSATFLMNFIRDWAKTGSVIVLDPKGELYQQTAADYRQRFRLDLQNTAVSDSWNFVPACKGQAEFAHEVASIIIGLDQTRHSTESEKFWQVSEIAALTAILLHLPELVSDPTPAMINEFIATRDLDPSDDKNSLPMAREMLTSPSLDARLYWGMFAKAKRELQGSILTGLSVKCAPFCTPNVKIVTTCDPNDPARTIDLRMLRAPGTAIYVVIPEGDASRYSTFLATFFGLAMDVLRRTTVDASSVPSLFVFDEAGNIPIHGLGAMLGVGRGRKVGLVLGYQNIAQVYSQYGREGGDAILGSIGTMIFLPGLDDRTARYAAGRVGKTTVLQRTTVDAVGTKYDNERVAEAARDLLDHSELRQLVRHTQAVAIIDTVPPVKFRFPSLALRGNLASPEGRDSIDPISLMKAEGRVDTESKGHVKSAAQQTNTADGAKTDTEQRGEIASDEAQEPTTEPETEAGTSSRSDESDTDPI